MSKEIKKEEIREEFKVSGEELVHKVKQLIHEGNIRRIIIKDEKEETVMEFPLTVGIIGTLLAPVLAAVGVLATLMTKCIIVVIKKK